MEPNFTMEAVKVKIEKLMRLSASPNEHEAASALAKAEALMAEYNLAHSEILMDEKQTSSNDVVKTVFGEDIEDWEGALASGIARIFGVKMYNSVSHVIIKRRRSSRKSIVLYGLPMDVETVKGMFTMVKETIEGEAIVDFLLQKYLGVIGKDRGATLAYKRGWFNGAVERIIQRVKDQRDYTIAQENKMTSLVIRKGDLIRQKMAQDGVSLTSAKSSSAKSSAAGWAAGRAAGDRIGLNKLVG